MKLVISMTLFLIDFMSFSNHCDRIFQLLFNCESVFLFHIDSVFA